MADFGIICEFNPIHNGHVRLINEARAMGAERVVCVMSGNAVQRGELAIADKYARAEMALKCGADVVLELPYPYSAASAEYFAKAGISVLSEFCDSIIFGSECGDAEYIKGAADAADAVGFRETVAQRVQNGEGSAAVYFSELEGRGYSKLSSNDILGIEYLRAIKAQKSDIAVYTIKRNGADYNDEKLTEGEAPSATAIRRALLSGEESSRLSSFMPDEALAIVNGIADGGKITDMNELSAATVAFFRLHCANDFEGIAEAGGGLVNRICSLARESTDAEELFAMLRTKKYTDARIRRAILFCMTGVTHALLDSPIEYTTLLAANKRGRELLSENRKTRKMLVVTKPSDVPEGSQTDANDKLDALFTLARAKKEAAGAMRIKKAYIES